MKKTQGFSLIELLIVLAIVGIMTSIVLGISARDKTRTEVRAVADEVAERINDARQRSTSGDTGSTTQKACGFGVDFPTAGGYTVFYNQTASGVCASTFSVSSSSLFTWANTARVIVSGGTTLFFSVPFGSFSGGVSDIPVSSTSGGVTFHVCVSDRGVVEVKESCS